MLELSDEGENGEGRGKERRADGLSSCDSRELSRARANTSNNDKLRMRYEGMHMRTLQQIYRQRIVSCRPPTLSKGLTQLPLQLEHTKTITHAR